MRYLLDSDVAKKLAQYDLIIELANSLGCGLSDFTVLPQLKFQLSLFDAGKALQKLGSERAADAAKALVAAAVEVEIDNPNNPLLSLNTPGIDTGESVLLAALTEREEDKLISGDKCAFRALSDLSPNPVIDSLWPRMICLEQAIALIIKSNQFESISNKIRERPDVDTALSSIFGRSQACGRQDAEEGLESYITDLVEETDGLFQTFDQH